MKNFDWSNDKVSSKSSNFTISLDHHGEGIDGDYNPKDPNDKKLLRYDIFHNQDLSEAIPNGSSCTQLDSSLTPEEAKVILDKVLVMVEDQYQKYGNPNLGTIARMLESLDWTSLKP